MFSLAAQRVISVLYDIGDGLLRLDNFLGHGRKLEASLVFVKLQYAALLLVAPHDEIVILAFWPVPVAQELIALLFLAIAAVQLVGLLLNAKGYKQSKWWRVVGATAGLAVWLFILGENVFVLHVVFAGQNPWYLLGAVGSVTLIRSGIRGLPKPGAPGAI